MNSRTMLTAAAACGCLLASRGHAQFGAGPTELELIQINNDMYVVGNAAVAGLSTALITDEYR